LADHPISKLIGEPLYKVDRADGLKLYHDADNWLLIRPSGTEPVIRVSGEGRSEQLIDSLMVDFKSQIDEILKGFKVDAMPPAKSKHTAEVI
jgi:phosphomannomutase